MDLDWIMQLTESAIKKVGELIKDSQISTPDNKLFLRLNVNPGGCSGLRYDLYFDYTEKNDEVIPYQDFDVRIDKMSWPYLKGSVMDFKDSLNAMGFSIDNPNAQGSCACGDSFS